MANDNAKTAAPESPSAERTRSGVFYRPAVDILERGDELLLRANVAGACGEDIDLEFDGGMLTIHARVAPRQEPGKQYLMREYGVGDYYRTFEISEAINVSQITAECTDGVLTLHLPKAEAVKPRKITVQTR